MDLMAISADNGLDTLTYGRETPKRIIPQDEGHLARVFRGVSGDGF